MSAPFPFAPPYGFYYLPYPPYPPYPVSPFAFRLTPPVAVTSEAAPFLKRRRSDEKLLPPANKEPHGALVLPNASGSSSAASGRVLYASSASSHVEKRLCTRVPPASIEGVGVSSNKCEGSIASLPVPEVDTPIVLNHRVWGVDETLFSCAGQQLGMFPLSRAARPGWAGSAQPVYCLPNLISRFNSTLNRPIAVTSEAAPALKRKRSDGELVPPANKEQHGGFALPHAAGSSSADSTQAVYPSSSASSPTLGDEHARNSNTGWLSGTYQTSFFNFYTPNIRPLRFINDHPLLARTTRKKHSFSSSSTTRLVHPNPSSSTSTHAPFPRQVIANDQSPVSIQPVCPLPNLVSRPVAVTSEAAPVLKRKGSDEELVPPANKEQHDEFASGSSSADLTQAVYVSSSASSRVLGDGHAFNSRTGSLFDSDRSSFFDSDVSDIRPLDFIDNQVIRENHTFSSSSTMRLAHPKLSSSVGQVRGQAAQLGLHLAHEVVVFKRNKHSPFLGADGTEDKYSHYFWIPGKYRQREENVRARQEAEAREL